MATKTGIGWTNHTFSPWWVCTEVSPGCDNCFAKVLAARRGIAWGVGAPRILQSDQFWTLPAMWNRRAEKTGIREMVFCASMCDVFDAEQPELLEPERQKLWTEIRQTPRLIWQLLTKRPNLIGKMLPPDLHGAPNIWPGTSIENADYVWRIKELIETPAVVHFLSVEPVLGPIPNLPLAGIEWVITGGESGKGYREMSLKAFWGIVQQVQAAKVPLFVKQDSGSRDGQQGRIPDHLWIKEFPR